MEKFTAFIVQAVHRSAVSAAERFPLLSAALSAIGRHQAAAYQLLHQRLLREAAISIWIVLAFFSVQLSPYCTVLGSTAVEKFTAFAATAMGKFSLLLHTELF